MRIELKLFDQARAAEVQRSKNSVLIPRHSVLYLALSALFFGLCSLLLAPCSSAEAQQPKKVARIGYLSDSNPARESARSKAIQLALRELGYTEGQNITTEYRYAGKARSGS